MEKAEKNKASLAHLVGIEATELKINFKLNNQNFQIGWVPEILKSKITGFRSCAYTVFCLIKHNGMTGTFDLTPFYYLNDERGYLPTEQIMLNCPKVTHYQNLTESAYVVKFSDSCERGVWRNPNQINISLYVPVGVSLQNNNKNIVSTTYDNFELVLSKVVRSNATSVLFKHIEQNSLAGYLTFYRRRIEEHMLFTMWSMKHKTAKNETYMSSYMQFLQERDMFLKALHENNEW